MRRLGRLLATLLLLGSAPDAVAERGDPLAIPLARIEAVRTAMRSGMLTEALLATASLADSSPTLTQATPTEPIAKVSGQIARLAAAVRAASSIARSAVRGPIDRRAYSVPTAEPARSSSPGTVDMRRMLTAATLVTKALDAGISTLGDAPVPRDLGQTAGCDVLDQAPILCVAGDGTNTITQDYALVIDLGGNDVHRHSSGGADPLGNTLPVSVTVDLAGDDRYETTVTQEHGSAAVLGSGVFGVGILVDAAGNDTYIATSNDAEVHAAGSSFLGVGLLADLAGDDSYRVSATSPGGAQANGFGVAQAGLATFQDRGGSDSYVVEARPILAVDAIEQVYAGRAVAQGMGVNHPAAGEVGPAAVMVVVAAGTFADAAGNDRIQIVAESATIPPDDGRSLIPGRAEVRAAGFSDGSFQSLALTGPGSTAWSLVARTSANSSPAFVTGFGFGTSGGFGAISDEGGDDEYLSLASATAERSIIIAQAPEEMESTATGGAARVVTHGVADPFGRGLLEEQGGDDRYVARAETFARSEIEDRRDDHASTPPVARAVAGPAELLAQGAAEGSGLDDLRGLGGSGLLLDREGDDHYNATALAKADARSDAASLRERRAFSRTEPADTLAQGAAVESGRGELRDLGGSDRYETSSLTSAVATPSSGAEQGSIQTHALAGVDGSGIAMFTDSDGGRLDTFASAPDRPTCLGTRGHDVWRDCGAVLGLGVNR